MEDSASKLQVFVMKCVFKEALNLNIIATILNSTQQPGHIL